MHYDDFINIFISIENRPFAVSSLSVMHGKADNTPNTRLTIRSTLENSHRINFETGF